MALHWNAEFTKRIRTHNDAAWGTITLSSDVPLGAYGIFDGNQEFQQLGQLALSADTSFTAVGNYSSTDSGVKNTQMGASVSGQFVDPETGTEVTAGLQWQWSFSKENSFLLQLPQVYATRYVNVTEAMQEAETQLVEMANQNGWTHSDGTVKEGWCMIVEVLEIAAGFVTGSMSSSNSFTINGAVNAMNRLMEGEANAAYSAANSSDQNNMFTWIWPIDPYTDNDNGHDVSSMTNLKTLAVVPATFNHKQVVFPYAG